MIHRSLALACTAASLFGLGLLAGSVIGPALQPRPTAPAAALPGADLRPGAVSLTDRRLGLLQERLRRPGEADPRALSDLAALYLQKARESGDPSFYARADALLQQAYALDPDDPPTLVGLGALALARHDFFQALAWGERAAALHPASPAGHGVLADALMELGRYEESVAAIQRMVDLRPDQAAYARVSYAREIHGDVPGAIEAMARAVEMGVAGSEPTEWARVHLGHLYASSGDLEAAEMAYRDSLALAPDGVHATAGLARVAAARGAYAEAIRLYHAATLAQPIPAYVSALAEVYDAAGQPDDAVRQRDLLRAMQALYAASGVSTDLEMALFEAEFGGAEGAARAVAAARALWDAGQRSIAAADALAWSLYQAGDCQAADTYATEALRTGVRDALVRVRAGQIAACMGDAPRARALLAEALAINPVPSPRSAPQARAALAALEGAAR